MSVELPSRPPEPQPRRVRLRRALGRAYDVKGLRSGYGLRPLTLILLLDFFSGVANNLKFLQPLIKRDLGLDFFKFQAIASAAGILGILFAGPLGYLADRVKRTFLVGLGGLLSAASLVGIGYGYTPLVNGGANALGTAANDLTQIPSFSLLADYYPVEQRVTVFWLLNFGGLLAGLILPVPVGWMVSNFGWRVPFWVLWIPTAIIALLIMFRLREPQRGYQERKSLGASEEVASREQPPPSWAEAWRLTWSVRTVRYLLYAALINGFTTILLTYRTFYFIDVYHQTPALLAVVQTVQSVIALVVLVAGGGVIQYLVSTRPARVLQISGAVSLAGAVAALVFIVVPNFWASTVASWLVFSAEILLLSALNAVILNVIPPRCRGTTLSAVKYFGVPALLMAPFIGSLIDSYGLRPVLIVGLILPIIGSIIYFVAARYYESDIRNAKLSAMATEDHDRSKREGRAKQLVCRQLDVYYGSVQVLFSVDFDVNAGEIVALLGTNGAGKSTVLRAICGLSEASGGAIVLDGDDITHIPPNEIAARGVVYMQGGKSGFPSLTVRENLDLGSWMHGKREDHGALMERVFEYFPVLRQRLDQVAGTLSGGEQQMLALSQAFLSRPRLLLIDELALGLAPAVVEQLLSIVRAIHATGTTVVVVDQSVNTALKLAKRAVFLEKGEVRFTGPAEELLQRPDILRSVFLKGASAGVGGGGAGVSAFATAGMTVNERRALALAAAAPILEVRHLTKSFGGRRALDDVSFALRDGEILGIIGANGAGKTTLLDVIGGYTPEDEGQIVFAGTDITGLSPDARARLGLIRRFQDARLFPTLTVREAISIFFERELEVRNLLLSGIDLPATRRQERRLKSKVESLVEMMSLQAFAGKFVADLSTGTRRIVDLACVIATQPKVLLLDEPSAGIAQKETEEMGPLLQRVRHQTGCSMVVIEHDMRLISSLADELLAMHLGAVMTRGEPKVVLEDDRVVSAYLGAAAAPVAAG